MFLRPSSLHDLFHWGYFEGYTKAPYGVILWPLLTSAISQRQYETRQLANLLAEEIQSEIDVVVANQCRDIVERLNQMGNDLKLEYESLPEISLTAMIGKMNRAMTASCESVSIRSYPPATPIW